MRVSLFLPHVVPVSALYILIVLYALDLVYLMCSANVSFGSKFNPSILGNGFVTSKLLSIVRLRDLEYSAGSGGNKVVWVLAVLSFRLLSIAQAEIAFRYGWRFVSAVL